MATEQEWQTEKSKCESVPKMPPSETCVPDLPRCPPGGRGLEVGEGEQNFTGLLVATYRFTSVTHTLVLLENTK